MLMSLMINITDDMYEKRYEPERILSSRDVRKLDVNTMAGYKTYRHVLEIC